MALRRVPSWDTITLCDRFIGCLELLQNKRVPSTMANIQQTLRHLFEINQKYGRETQVLTILYELAIPARRNGLKV
jgi:hypothetical protein